MINLFLSLRHKVLYTSNNVTNMSSSSNEELVYDFEHHILAATNKVGDTNMPEASNISIELGENDIVEELQDNDLAQDLGDNDLVDIKAFKGLLNPQFTIESNFAKLNANMMSLTETINTFMKKKASPTSAAMGHQAHHQFLSALGHKTRTRLHPYLQPFKMYRNFWILNLPLKATLQSLMQTWWVSRRQ